MITRAGSPIRPVNTSGTWVRAKPIPPEKRDYRQLEIGQIPNDDKTTYHDLGIYFREIMRCGGAD
jgi:hypothetical protein